MKKNSMRMLLAVILCSTVLSASAITINGNGFQQMKIGNIEAIVLSDGYFHMAPVQPSMAPDIASKQVEDCLKASNQSTKAIDLAVNILLLKKDDKLILFDAGAGSGMGQATGWLKDNLATIGVKPDQITDVILTHAHLDHLAGLLDSEGKSRYSNADIYLTKVEYDFWMSENPDFSKSKSKDTVMIATMIKYIRNILTTLQPQIKLIADKDILFDCLQVELAPGHTPGHIITTIFSNDEKMVAMADIVHASNILFAHPKWGNGYDYNFELGVKTRLAVLKRMHKDNALLFGYHLPYPGIGRVKELSADSYEWIPADFATPQLKD